MIRKRLPGFSFQEPRNKDVLNIRFSSVNVSVGTRALRATWHPELAQDLQAYQNIDAEAELTAILSEEIRNEIDNQIIRDLQSLNPTQRHLNQWTDLIRNQNDVLIHHGHRPMGDIDAPVLGGNPPGLLPLAGRIAARTMGMDLLTVQPLDVPTGLVYYLDYSYDGANGNILLPNYTVLPNEDGWYAGGTFESTMIKMEIKPFKFNPRRTRRERRSPYVRPGIY